MKYLLFHDIGFVVPMIVRLMQKIYLHGTETSTGAGHKMLFLREVHLYSCWKRMIAFPNRLTSRRHWNRCRAPPNVLMKNGVILTRQIIKAFVVGTLLIKLALDGSPIPLRYIQDVVAHRRRIGRAEGKHCTKARPFRLLLYSIERLKIYRISASLTENGPYAHAEHAIERHKIALEQGIDVNGSFGVLRG